MKRRMAMLVAVTAVSGVMTLFSPSATPAQAADVCVGQGQAQLTGDSFYYPVVGENSTAAVTTGTVRATLTPRSSGVVYHVTNGICLPSLSTVSGSAMVHGWCGLSFGSGVNSFGRPFHWVGIGSLLLITGGVTGSADLEANSLTGDSCMSSPGANDFLITKASLGTNCAIAPIGTSSSIASISFTSTNLSTITGSIRGHVTSGGHVHWRYTACVGT